MKNRTIPGPQRAMAALTLLALGTVSVAAQNSSGATNSSNPTEMAAPGSSSEVKLSAGARDVLNLSTAKASEGTIVSFIESSEASYTLSASDIIYLRQQGVSDRVITAMLNHRKEVAEANARVAARNRTDAVASSSRTPQDTQRETADVQPAASAVAPSTVYVVPSSPPEVYYDYHDYYPGPRGYYGFPYPVWSFSIGFGSGFRGGGFHHRGFHGGRHR